MLTIVIFPILFVSLFILYVLCKDDFLLIRKDIKMPFLFNNIFLINPLVFFHLVNYGGLSIFGGFLGGIFGLLLFTSEKKAAGRILDISSLSFFPLLFLYLFSKPFSDFFVPLKFVIPLLLIAMFIIFLNFHKKYSLKDGNIFLYILILFSIFNLVFGFFNAHGIVLWRFSFSQTLSAFWILFSVIILVARSKNLLFKK